MRKEISTQELKASVGEVMDSVRLRDDCYVITRRNKPLAALVPLSILESYERNSERLADLMERVSSREKDVDEAELEKIINETIADVRAERRNKQEVA